MQAPQRVVWGPALWSLLHAMAEATKGGKKEAEEKRLWRQLLLSLRAVIPCPTCQKHYNDYIKIHSWIPVFERKGDEWMSGLRAYLWTFHNAVRSEKGQPFDFEATQLATTYSVPKAALVPWKRTWTEHMRRGLPLHLLTHDDMMRSLRNLEELILAVYL